MITPLDSNYNNWSKNHNFADTRQNKKEYKAVKRVRDRFSAMKLSRDNSCYIYTENGGSWDYKWDTDDKIATMWSLYAAFQDKRSNIKLPMTKGRLKAFINQIKKLNFSYDALPNDEHDRNSARIASEIVNFIIRNTDSLNSIISAFQDDARYGDGFFRTQYLHEKRKYKYVKTKDLTKEESEKMKEGDIIFTDEQEVVVIDTPTITYIPIRELFWDPNAVTDHGEVNFARDVIWRRIIPFDEAKRLLKNMPNSKNIDKIKPSSVYTTLLPYEGFFKSPSDTAGGEYVEWLEYESLEDHHMIICNDICVLDTPLPQNFKEITFHKISYDRENNQFYSRGMCDDLKNIQGSEEVLLNIATDHAYQTNLIKMMVGSSVAGEINNDTLSGDNSVIIVDDSLGTDIRSKIMPINLPPITQELFRIFDIYERQATIASGMDPSQLSLMPAGKTATATLQNKEQLELGISGIIFNAMNTGLKTAGQQLWELVVQHWKLPKLKEILGSKDNKAKPRSIRVEGIKIDFDKDTLKIKDDVDFSFLDVKEDYLNTREKLDIFIRPSSVEIESKSLEQQKVQQELAQLQPFMVDPDNIQQMQTHPFPYINGPKWFKERYSTIMGLPSNVLIDTSKSDEIEVKKAEEDVMRILKGEEVAGKAGSSVAHRRYEAQVLIALQSKLQEIKEKIELQVDEKLAMTQPMIDPMSGMPIEQPEPNASPELLKQEQELQKIIDRLARHIETDNTPEGLIEERALEISKPQVPPAPPMMSPAESTVPMPTSSNFVPQMQGGLPEMNPEQQIQPI